MDNRARTLIGWAVTVLLAAVVVVGLVMGDSAPQDRVEALGSRIKCPVCQGEAIGDSPSETSAVMMDIVAEKVAAGETDAQIISYFTARYGDGILLDGPCADDSLPAARLAAAKLEMLPDTVSTGTKLELSWASPKAR